MTIPNSNPFIAYVHDGMRRSNVSFSLTFTFSFTNDSVCPSAVAWVRLNCVTVLVSKSIIDPGASVYFCFFHPVRFCSIHCYNSTTYHNIQSLLRSNSNEFSIVRNYHLSLMIQLITYRIIVTDLNPTMAVTCKVTFSALSASIWDADNAWAHKNKIKMH